jgi:hypothetical protein
MESDIIMFNDYCDTSFMILDMYDLDQTAGEVNFL